MDKDWHKNFDEHLQRFKEKVFQSFMEIKDDYEQMFGPFGLDTAIYFCGMLNIRANYAYHQFIFESGLTECVEEIPMENSNVTNGNSRSSPPSTPQSPSVLPPPPSPEEKSLPINAKRKNSIKNGIESVKRSKALTAPEVSEIKHTKEKPLPPVLDELCSPPPSALLPPPLPPKPKNTDINIYSNHQSYAFKCVLCNRSEMNLVQHYVDEHPESEVFISRLPPIMAQAVRKQTRILQLNICFFCEKDPKSIDDWRAHIRSHTGETEFYCFECHSSFNIKEDHGNCSVDNVKSIFDAPDLIAFMCKICNFIQINKHQISKHLEQEHGYIGSAITENIDEIVLKYSDDGLSQTITEQVVEVSNESKLPTIKFIEESSRFKCGVQNCTSLVTFGNEKRMFHHLRNDHDVNDSFQCAHCNGSTVLVKNALSHLQLHGDQLYQCITCTRICSTEFLMILHILRDHPSNDFRFQHVYRSENDKIENILFSFKCNACGYHLRQAADLLKHFREVHGSMLIDFTVLRAPNANRLLLQQRLVCMLCNTIFATKSEIIAHHHQAHVGTELKLKISKIMQVEAEKFPQSQEFTRQNLRYDRYIVFYCSHCMGVDKCTYTDLHAVHQHWIAKHKKLSIEFRFEIAELMACFTCKTISTFQGLKNHEHSEFAVYDLLNRYKCGICKFIGNELVNHFQMEHELLASVSNPFQIKGDVLEELLKVRFEKQLQCHHCNKVCATEIDMKKHHSDKHSGKDFLYEDFNGMPAPRLISGCCKMELAMNGLFEHFENHSRIDCTKCASMSLNLFKLAKHDVNEHSVEKDPLLHLQCLIRMFYYQTNVIFGNGLIIAKYNLIGTKFDDCRQLDDFIMKFIRKLASGQRRL